MSMDKGAADSYVYSKASGMLAKSFIGSRAVRLFEVHSLSELWGLLFKMEIPVIPEKLLARELENTAQKQFISDYIKLISNYSNPSPVFISLLHYYDYENIKAINANLAYGKKECSNIIDISPYNLLDYQQWPDIKKITQKDSIKWFDKVSPGPEQKNTDYLLDLQYVSELWDSCKAIKSECKDAILDLIGEKFIIDNVLWALRLKIYYKMPEDLIIQNLAYSDSLKSLRDPFVIEALKVLQWDVDNYEQWKDWKYVRLLNPNEVGNIWKVDPRWIFNSYKTEYVKKAKRLFHQFPFTEGPLICYFIIKQNELDNIRTASECLCLNINQQLAMEKVGVSEENNG